MKIKPMPFNADMTKAIWEGRKTVTRRPVKGYALEHLEVDVDGSVIGVYQQDEGTVFPAVSFAPYQPGEIVYVPEAWRALCSWQKGPLTAPRYGYAVKFKDGKELEFYFDDAERAAKWEKYIDKPRDHWQSPYFMPREAARLFLRVTGVRVERLQESFFDHNDRVIRALMREGVSIPAECENCIKIYGNPCCSDLLSWSPVDPATGEDEEGGSECGVLDDVRAEFADLWDSTIQPKDRDRLGWAANPWVWVIEFERITKVEVLIEHDE